MAVQRLGDISPAQRTILEGKTLLRALPKLHFARLAKRREFMEQEGRAITFTRWTTLSAATTALNEGEVPVGESFATTTVTITPSFYGSFFELSKQFVLKGIFEVKVLDAPELLGEQAGRTIDTLARNTVDAGVTAAPAGGQASEGAVTAVDVMGFDELVNARRLLQRNDALPFAELGDRYALLIHPDNEYDFIMDSTIQTFYAHGVAAGSDTPWFGRAILDILDVRVFVSSNINSTNSGGSGSVDTYDCFMLGRDCFAIAGLGGLLPAYEEGGTGAPPLGTTPLMFNDWEMYVPMRNKCSISWLFDSGQGILNSTYGVQIFAASSRGSN